MPPELRPCECAHIESCELYPHFRLSSSLAIWQQRYCLGDFKSCQRYVRSSAGKPVSPLMLPNGEMLRLLR